MDVNILASGSKGNSCLIKTSHHNILIDIGTTFKYIKNALKSVNLSPDKIDYIFISHTHKDHISALKGFIKNNNPFVCLSEKMFNDLEELQNYNKILIYNDEIILDDLNIEIFKTSHDASDSRGFIIKSNNSQIVYVTDTGYINSKLFKKLYNKDMYIIESNHDPQKLREGKYPVWLQNRILSDYGHLSNQMTGTYLSKLIGPKTKKIILAHLSEENNDKELALKTVKYILKESGIKFNNIECAKQFINTEVDVV